MKSVEIRALTGLALAWAMAMAMAMAGTSQAAHHAHGGLLSEL